MSADHHITINNNLNLYETFLRMGCCGLQLAQTTFRDARSLLSGLFRATAPPG